MLRSGDMVIIKAMFHNAATKQRRQIVPEHFLWNWANQYLNTIGRVLSTEPESSEGTVLYRDEASYSVEVAGEPLWMACDMNTPKKRREVFVFTESDLEKV